jgi:predicted kinase
MDLGDNTFTLLCGIPASGKTTWLRQVAAENPAIAIISSDDRLEERCLAEGLSYQAAYAKHAKATLADLFRDAVQAMGEGKPVIWDQTNLSVAARAERLALVPSGYLRQAVAFEIGGTETARRLKARELATDKAIPDFVLAKQKADYVRPALSEGLDLVWLDSGEGLRLLDGHCAGAASPRF